MASKEANERVEMMLRHIQQVEAGLIPEDSPPTFTLPQALDDRGLPWWFGPDYKPTDRMLEATAKQNAEPRPGDDPRAQGELFPD
jgi:hypothetical protein